MPMDYLDVSTRSTDVMLEPVDDEPNFTKPKSKGYGRTLDSSGGSEDDYSEHSSNGSKVRTPVTQFSHLVPKKHSKMAKAYEKKQIHSSMGESFQFKDKYRYELWEGKNKFLCNGRIMMGVHNKHLLLSLTLLILTYGVFLGVIVPMLHMPILFYAGLFLCTGNIVFLLLTAFTEPGIIPRRPPSKLLESMTEDARAKVQYCHTCRIVRPPRAKHCRYCDNCVEVFDHHCPWTGTCIGVRNYGYFCVFITLTVLSSAFACAVSAYLIVLWAEGISHENVVMTYLRDTVAPLICVFTFLVFVLVGSLLAFHIFLIGRAQTTNEFLRGVRPSNSDYKNSTTGNVVRLCYRTVPDSKLLPMWEKCRPEDAEHDSNAVAHAIDSLRSAIENDL
mmetsp:Transcript_1699/g.2678  ORF Transcript_1699/g.2678 Transcript_1699/m.2678 type:complete len:389 (+) Transcript_1699:140-1306(+)